MTSLIRRRAFTLIELMVAMVVTALLIGMLVGIANFTSSAWKSGSDRVETFSGARSALSLIGRELQGAVIDLDLGYRISSKNSSGNDCVLKFLVRRQPTAEEPSGLQKIAYQLAWASPAILPEIQSTYDAGHPISVLVRTASYSEAEMEEFFDITGDKKPSDWANDDWPSKAELNSPNKTAVVAENVLGWQVNPIYLYNESGTDWKLEVDRPNTTVPVSYVDDGGANPLYITSDLKYVKKVLGLPKLNSKSAPRALEIRLAAVPSSILPRLTQAGGLGGVRDLGNLFKPDQLSTSSFDRLLKQNLRIFDATYYLSSKTP